MKINITIDTATDEGVFIIHLLSEYFQDEEQPVRQHPPTEITPQPVPDPGPSEAVQPSYSMEDIRLAMTPKLASIDNRTAIRDQLDTLEVNTVNDLPLESRADFITFLNSLPK